MGGHDPREDTHFGDRRRRLRRGRGRRVQRLLAPVDAHRLRQYPHLQLADFIEVLDFWFGTPGSAERGRPRKAWFSKSDAFDEEIRRRFLPLWQSASRGELAPWGATPLASLALIVVLDQFPRNMFRGDARAFSTDSRALDAAEQAVSRGFDRLPLDHERTFLYLPFEHAEDRAVQRRSLELFAARDPENLEWARRHHEIVERFGRFPHRNAALGRKSTPEEVEFLKRPGSFF